MQNIISFFLRRLAMRGIRTGINKFSSNDKSPEDRRQQRSMSRKLRNTTRMMRRFGRF